MWKYTESFLSHTKSNFTAIVAFFAVFYLGMAAFTQGGVVIDYYCSQSSPPIFGLYINGYSLCPVYSVALFILATTLSIMAIWFLGVLSIDIIKYTTGRVKFLFTNPRNARITVVVASVENEHFIAVRNDEFWLRADNVVVNSRFIFYDNKYDGNIKWSEDNSKDGKTSISGRKHKTLHAITTTNDGFIIHMNEGDKTFPFPGEDDPYYAFPLYISGSMSFLGYTVERIKLVAYEEVMITQDRKVEIRHRKSV